MNKKDRAVAAAELLQKEYPEPKTELIYENEMQLAVAVMLSAQTTDKKVNEVTQSKLFPKYKTWDDFANADLEDLREAIHGVNFHKGKAERLIKAGKLVICDFNGNLPRTIDELITIPGVARKTANVVLQELWGIAEGIVVDTHVTRLSQRLELTSESNAVKIEKVLMNLLPKKYWRHISNAMVLHGRYVCKARKAECAECIIKDICPSAFRVN